MTYGDLITIHGFQWMVLSDYGNGHVLAVTYPLVGVSQPMFIDTVINNETGARCPVEGNVA